MKEKLEQKCIEYLDANFTTDEITEKLPRCEQEYAFWFEDVYNLAQHFYNLALADVREEVERRLIGYDADYTSAGKELKALLSFIDNLTK